MINLKVPTLVCYGVTAGAETNSFLHNMAQHSQYQQWVEEARRHVFKGSELIPKAYVNKIANDTGVIDSSSIFNLDHTTWSIAGYCLCFKEYRYITRSMGEFIQIYCATRYLKSLEWNFRCNLSECYDNVDFDSVYDDSMDYHVIFNQMIEEEREKKYITLQKKKRGVKQTFEKRQRVYEIQMKRVDREIVFCTKSTFIARKFP